ncbi:MAG TPA: ASCH domain-containing protein [Alphaproteobacteria bacterium]
MKEIEQKFWESYTDTLSASQRPDNPYIEVAYAGNKFITDDLLELYLTGKKTAGSSLVADFKAANDLLPKVGNYWIILNSVNEPKCIVKTMKTAINKFKDIASEIAIAEGEGDLSVEYWKAVHSSFYTPHLKEWGIDNLNEALVVTEFFDVVWPKNNGERKWDC